MNARLRKQADAPKGKRPVRLDNRVQEDAVALRGIVELLSEGPATTCEIEMIQQISDHTRRRLLKILECAGIAERETVRRTAAGRSQKVPTKRWLLTHDFRAGRIAFEPEMLARIGARA